MVRSQVCTKSTIGIPDYPRTTRKWFLLKTPGTEYRRARQPPDSMLPRRLSASELREGTGSPAPIGLRFSNRRTRASRDAECEPHNNCKGLIAKDSRPIFLEVPRPRFVGAPAGRHRPRSRGSRRTEPRIASMWAAAMGGKVDVSIQKTLYTFLKNRCLTVRRTYLCVP